MTSILHRLVLAAAALCYCSVHSFSSSPRTTIAHHSSSCSCIEARHATSHVQKSIWMSSSRRSATSFPIVSKEELETDIIIDNNSNNSALTATSPQQTANAATIDTTTQEEQTVPSTWNQAIQHFFFGDNIGPPLVVLTISGFILTRCQLLPTTPFSINEGLVFLSSIVFWWGQEYLFHRVLLHSPFNWIGKSIHAGHHDKDYFHVSIDPPALLLGWLFTAHFVLKALIPQWHLCLSATIGYSLAGLIYEWSHYIVHTRVKPRVIPVTSPSYPQLSLVQRTIIQPIMRSYAKMRDNHIRHHLIDSRYWYAFSVTEMDSLFGTNPNVKDVKREMGR